MATNLRNKRKWKENDPKEKKRKENVSSLDIGRVERRLIMLSLIPTVLDTRYNKIIQ